MTKKSRNRLKRVRIFHEFDHLELPVESIFVHDEEQLSDIASSIESQLRSSTPGSTSSLRADEPRGQLEELTSPEALSDLEDIISVYVARKKYWCGVIRPGDQVVKRLKKLGREAGKLLTELRHLQSERLLHQNDFDRLQLSQVLDVLAQIAKLEHEKHGAREKDLPDLEQDLAWDLIIWWKRTTNAGPKFWITPDALGTSQSPFMQFVSAVFSAIPDEYRPIASRGTPGLTRKPFQKKHKQLQERERNLERFSAWLSKQSVEQRRRRNPDQLCFELRSN